MFPETLTLLQRDVLMQATSSEKQEWYLVLKETFQIIKPKFLPLQATISYNPFHQVPTEKHLETFLSVTSMRR